MKTEYEKIQERIRTINRQIENGKTPSKAIKALLYERDNLLERRDKYVFNCKQ